MGWTPTDVTGLNRIDHIRPVFFQIRVKNRKRALPGFQMNMILCLGRKSNQYRHNQADPSDSEFCAVIGPQT